MGSHPTEESTMRSHDATVHQQFDPQARAYLTSAVHAAGPDLARAAQLVGTALPATATALDVGCGAGHLSFALAPLLARITACDPAPSMLATVREAAAACGLGDRIATAAAPAQALPFDDARFCLVATRYSAHHWLDLEASLREMRRVLKPGGFLLVIDVLGGPTPLVDTHLQAMEVLRDPGHVRNRTATEWRAALRTAGFTVREEAGFALRLEFAAWIRRMRTPPEVAAAIRRFQAGAPRQVHEGLCIEADGSFGVTTGLFWST
jgi:ubiquinone/menaquinone biosynthesis C-methylase UbiE